MLGKMMRLMWMGGVALASMTVAASGLVAQQPSPPREIQVSASGEVQVKPDAAEIVLAVESVGTTAQQAGQANARTMQQVIAAVAAAGIPRDSVVTRGYSVYPEYAESKGGEPPRIRGYRASNEVVVKVSDLEQVGSLIDIALGAGANHFQGVNFLVSNPEPARQEALRRAVQRARESARVIASALGVGLGQVRMAATSINMPQPVAYARMRVMAEAAPTPIQPGAQTVQAHVTVSFAIEGS